MHSQVTKAATVATDAATAEKVMATVATPPLGNNPLISGVVVEFDCYNVAPGTSATGCVFKVKRGSTTSGTQITPTQNAGTITASAAGDKRITVYDTAPDGAGYCLTMVQTAGAAAGSIGQIIARATTVA